MITDNKIAKKVITQSFPDMFDCFLEGEPLEVFTQIVTMLNITFYRLYHMESLDFITPMYKNNIFYKYPVINFSFHVQSELTIKAVMDDTMHNMLTAYDDQYNENGKKRNIAKLGYASKELHSESDLEFLIENSNIEFLIILNQKKKSFECMYSKQYKSRYIEAIIEVFLQVLRFSIAQNMSSIHSIPIVTKNEKEKILCMSNGNRHKNHSTSSVAEIISHYFKLTPEKPCLIYSEQNLYNEDVEMKVCNYGDIEKLAYKAAGLINSLRKDSNAVVIITENPLLLVTGVIGCFIAGIPFLTLDCNIPHKRMNKIMSEINVKVMISDSFHIHLQDEEIHILGLENIERYNGEIHDNERNVHKAGYIMYTSGSTGNPKKFFVTESALLNYTIWRIQNYNISSEDNILQLLAPSFDGFFSNFFTCLLSGGTLVMPRVKMCSNYEEMPILIEKYKITNLSIVPCILELIVEKAKAENFKFLKSIVFGGDFSSAVLIKKCQSLNPRIRLINEYGPSENCIASTVNMSLTDTNVRDIGSPLPGTEIYILNKEMEIVPTYIKGDIYVGGIQLTEGYISYDENSFVENPFAEGEILFRTGDVGYWTNNGTICLSGRTDNQVNINGCRIELEEVEQAIKTYEKVNQAVVSVSKEANECVLCADVKGEADLTSRMVREYLLEILPTYMIPQRIHISNQIPLTAQGKPMRKKELADLYYQKELFELAEKIAAIWNKLLEKEISIFDDFFERGGSSLKIVIFINEFQEIFKSEIKIKDIFKYSTALELAQIINERKGGSL